MRIIRHDLAVNYSNLKRLDDQVGTILNQLKEDGLYDNSIIFFYGDHGGPFPEAQKGALRIGDQGAHDHQISKKCQGRQQG